MASSKFDELTRVLAASTSRRETIKVLFASFLGGALGFGGIGTVQAAGEDLRTESAVPCSSGCGGTSDTDFLWQKVQDCEVNQTHCTAVDPSHQWVLAKESQKNNYTLIAGHRITGIECPMIWQHTNPDYWAFALQAAKDHLQVPLGKFGLAINAMGPTYRHSCQLHIHVSCIDTGVQNYLQIHDGSITTNPSLWNSSPSLGLGNPAHSYHVLHLSSLSSGGQNLFQLLKNVVGASNMQNQTLVVAARNLTGGGFYILSSDHTQGGTGGGENLLYEMC
jgi:CDP-diacylglycerol pyrophosphatase